MRAFRKIAASAAVTTPLMPNTSTTSTRLFYLSRPKARPYSLMTIWLTGSGQMTDLISSMRERRRPRATRPITYFHCL